MQTRVTMRLRGYDYGQTGAYFITICTYQRTLLFETSSFAEAAALEWVQSADRGDGIELDAFVVMPNHIHGIVWLLDDESHPSVEAQRAAPFDVGERAQHAAPLRVVPGSLGAFVRGYKSAVARSINIVRGTPGAPVWQRNYFDHIVRDEDDLRRIRQYIEDNPRRWEQDREHPQARLDAYEVDFWLPRS